MPITKQNGQVVGEVAVLQEYFGRKEGQSLQEFMAETKALTPESRTELANGAALALGYTVA